MLRILVHDTTVSLSENLVPWTFRRHKNFIKLIA